MSDYINFKSFVDDYVAIEIPILQRDYAQGRAAQNNLSTLNAKGANFLTFLMEALENGHQQELDFIYGSCEIRDEQNDNDKTFLPLDGQQRLTTLWLLHWYLAQANNKMDEWQKKLAKFTYATRTSARDFCRRLVKLRLDVEQLKSPSGIIKGYLWFTSAFASDPTIDAMLRMLDAIAQQFEEREGKLGLQTAMERLENIVFRVFDIGTYGFSDELYIKMNGRGRALSSFENFKADFLGYLKKQEGFADEVREVSKKLDHAWAEMVWGAKQNKDFDKRYIRLFKRYLYNLWVINHLDYKEKEKDKTPDVLTNTFSGEAYVNFAPYAELLNKSEGEEVRKMCQFFDFLVSEQEKEYRKYFFAPWEKETSEYPYMMDKDVSMVDRLTLFALSEYVANSNTSNLPLENFAQWMRIVHHLLADPQLRTYRVQLDYMKAIQTLAVYAHEIESYLKELDITSLDFSNSIKKRLEHEKEKLNYLDKHANRREALLQLEKHVCLKGQVKFALDFEGNYDEFIVFCEKVAELISVDDDWSAKHLWPAVIAKCEGLIFDLSNPGDYDYFRHKEHGSGIQWRLQDLLNREHIAAAFREVVEEYVTSCQNNQGVANFEAVSKDICDNYNGGNLYHTNLIKLLPDHPWGRIYRRSNEELCLQTSWRVTQNKGYFNLEESDLKMRFK